MRLWTRGAGEYAVRRVYFSYPRLVRWYQSRRTQRRTAEATIVQWDTRAILSVLEQAIPPAADILVHSSMAGLGAQASPAVVLKALQQYCGEQRTVLFPTNPALSRDADGVAVYDPMRSGSTVGLLTEYVRRTPAFKRSLHPISSVVARGPAAESYLDENLNGEEPLPHGVFSPYARLAAAGGFTVCLGVPYYNAITMLHVSEETLDREFPLQLTFDRLRVRVRTTDSARDWWVRCRSMKYAPHVSMWSIRHDLMAAGAVQRFRPGGVVVDIVDNRKVVEFMQAKARQDGYPYMFLPRRRPSPH